MSLPLIRKFMIKIGADRVALLAWFLMASGVANANPNGGVVTAGSASINQAPGSTVIRQTSNAAIINWNSFSINKGEATRFIQPNAQSAVLNRVTGGQSSIINGALNANGQVFLINGNGILIGKDGAVNTGGFTASTRDISDSDFLGGKLHFTGSNDNGVQNLGTINALGGDVVLIGKTVDNQGSITAAKGTVGLAAGDDVLIAQTGSERVFVKATSGATDASGRTAVSNSGTIAATRAELRAANGNVYALAINNSGTVRASTVVQEGGDIYLTSDLGTVRNTGTLDASATAAKGKGGTVLIKTGGSAIQAGAIVAHGGNQGTGGFAEVSGKENVSFPGTIDLTSANGTTGTLLIDPVDLIIGAGGTPATDVENLLATANVDLNADNSVTIKQAITWTSANTLSLTTNNSDTSSIAINAAIDGANGTLIITTGGPGTITTTADIKVNAFQLTRGTWMQVAGQNGVPSTLPAFDVTTDFQIGKSKLVTFGRFAGGDGSVADPFQIVDIYGLQGLGSRSGIFYGPTDQNPDTPVYNFVLKNDIDASGTKTWRSGNGFAPIGDSGTPNGLSGIFDGANHTISNLYEHNIDQTLPLAPNDNGSLALFSITMVGSEIKNLTLKDIDYRLISDDTGSALIGGLVANNSSIITNVSVTGNIGGADNTVDSASLASVAVGGLVAVNSNGVITYSNAAVNMNLILSASGSAIGGLVGNNEATISNSFSTGNINIPMQGFNTSSLSGIGIGGFVGFQGGTGLIDNCYTVSNVTVNDNVIDGTTTPTPIGGFIGDIEDGIDGSSSHIQNVYSIGTVTEIASGAPNIYVGIFAGLFNSTDTNGAYYRGSGIIIGGGGESTGPVDGIHETNSSGGVQTGTTMPDLLSGNDAWVAATTTSGITQGYPTLAPSTPLPPTGDETSVTLTLTTPGKITYGDILTFDALVADLTLPGTFVSGGTVTLNIDSDGVLTALLDTTVNLGTNGHATLTLGVNSTNQLGVGSLNTIVAVYSGAEGFTGSSSDDLPALTVAPAKLTITPVGGSKTYGDVYAPTFTTAGLVAGDSVDNVHFTGAGLAATAPVNGGAAYTINASNATGTGIENNYTIDYGTANLTVDKANLTLTASNQTVKQNGNVNTTPTLGTTYTVGGLKNNDQLGNVLSTGPTLSSSQSTSQTGIYNGAIDISGALNTDLGANYNLVTQKGTLTVNSGLDTISISLGSNLGSSSTYGQTITLIATLSNLTSGGILKNGQVTFNQDGTIILSPVSVDGKSNTVTLTIPWLLDANPSAYSFTAFFDGLGFYAPAQTAAPFELNVAQKALVITAGTATKTYGSTGLTYSGGKQFTASGLVEGTSDSVTGVTLASNGEASTAQVNGGTPYAITASDATGTGLSNYAITYTDGSVTVNKAALTVSSGDATKVYGSTALNFNGQPFSTAGLVNGDTVTGVTFTSAGQVATANVQGGTAYALKASAATGTGVGNYDITYMDGALTVTPAALTLSALPQTVNVGSSVNLAAILGSTYKVTGLQNDDKLSDLLASGPTVSSSQGTFVPGTYADALTVTGALNASLGGNYTIAPGTAATLTVQPGPVAPIVPVIVQTPVNYENRLTQATSIDGNANYNSLFAQSDFYLANESHQYLLVPTSSGEPNGRYDKRDQGHIEGTENFRGIPVIAHASSFTVGTR